jgi:replication factor C subunit 3/5
MNNNDYNFDYDNVKIINENIPWIEKYRPKNLDEVKSHEQLITTLKNFIHNRDLPHLLFYGPPGTGKTSIILSCAKELYGNNIDLMTLQINVSEERGIEIVRNKILQFVQSKSFIFNENNKLFKLVILDEADAMTPDAQAILRRIIEKYTVNARFCLICNYIKKINLALQSRCTIFRLSPIPDDIIKEKIKEISKKEKLKINKEAIESIIDKSNGDFRKIINILQTGSMITNNITEDMINKTLGFPSNKEIDIMYNSLFNNSLNKSYKIITKIKDTEGYSLIDIIRLIFKKMLIGIDNGELSQENFISIIKKMSIIEYNLINNTNEFIQLTSFIGIFASLRK